MATAALLFSFWAAPVHTHADVRADAPETCAVCHSAHQSVAASAAPAVEFRPTRTGAVIAVRLAVLPPLRPPLSHRLPRAPPA